MRLVATEHEFATNENVKPGDLIRYPDNHISVATDRFSGVGRHRIIVNISSARFFHLRDLSKIRKIKLEYAKKDRANVIVEPSGAIHGLCSSRGMLYVHLMGVDYPSLPQPTNNRYISLTTGKVVHNLPDVIHLRFRYVEQ